MERAFKGVWIPKELWESKELTLQEKVFLAEIDSLDNSKGCYASNKHFSDFFGLSKNRCSEVIKALEDKGLIKIKYIMKKGTKSIEKRIIEVVDKSNRPIRESDRPIRDSDRPIRETGKGYSGKLEENNTFNNTDNNTDNNTMENQKQVSEIIQFWDNNGFGFSNMYGKEKLLSWLEDTNFKNPKEMIVKAMEISIENNVKKLRYVEAILKNWINESILTVEEVEDKKGASGNDTRDYADDVGDHGFKFYK